MGNIACIIGKCTWLVVSTVLLKLKDFCENRIA